MTSDSEILKKINEKYGELWFGNLFPTEVECGPRVYWRVVRAILAASEEPRNPNRLNAAELVLDKELPASTVRFINSNKPEDPKYNGEIVFDLDYAVLSPKINISLSFTDGVDLYLAVEQKSFNDLWNLLPTGNRQILDNTASKSGWMNVRAGNIIFQVVVQGHTVKEKAWSDWASSQPGWTPLRPNADKSEQGTKA